MKNILVLTNFSTRAKYAAEFAMQIAIKLKADILLCHAIEIIDNEPIAGQIAWPVIDPIAVREESLLNLNELAKNLKKKFLKEADEFTPYITCVNDVGKLSEVAANCIEEKAIDFVVIGSHKSNGLARFLLGSHTHSLVDSINRPILLIPETLTYKRITSMAYATDLTFGDAKVINYLIEIAKALDADVEVTHVSSCNLPGTDPTKIIKYNAKGYLPQDYPKVLYNSVKGDNIPKSLLEITSAGKADVLVLVHKRYNFFEKLFHASVSKQLVNNATIPLLILPYSFGVKTQDFSDDQLERYCFEPNDLR